MRLSVILSMILLIAGHPAHANDSIARVGVGGITFQKSDQIEMLQEVLEISTKTIRVHYRFLNHGDQDIRTTVAFPIPAYGWDTGVSSDSQNEKPLPFFKVLVDGQSISTTRDRKALLGKRDIAEQLRKIGLSEKQIFETFGDCSNNGNDDVVGYGMRCGISLTQKKKVAQLYGKEQTFDVLWKVSDTILWEQTFPAGKVTEVVHEYPPFVGSVYNAPFQRGSGYDFRLPTDYDPEKGKEACLDRETRRAIENKIKLHAERGASMVYVSVQEVEYILGTGRNWKGPIGDFKLRIKKDSPDQVISLCFPGKPRRIDGSTVEFSHSSFVPQDKLVVYFYTVATDPI